MRTMSLALSKETIDSLQELIQINLDARDGFLEVAEHTEDLNINSFFRELSQQRARQAADLQDLVAANAEKPQERGSIAAAAHRLVIELRAALKGGVKAMLSEAERGEDAIKEKYEDVLRDNETPEVVEIVRRHYAAVLAAHDRVRDLRDSYVEG